jgi:8-amino-7-oxononanoate synthase
MTSMSSYVDRENILRGLVERVAVEVRLDADAVDIYAPFESFGLDSLKAVTLSGLLEDWIGIELSPTLFWDYPNIDSLANHLADLRLPLQVPVLGQQVLA